MTSSCEFTLAHYAEILRCFRDRGYRFVSFADLDHEAGAQVILRHDVDLSLTAALEIAEIEAAANVSSVFHVLLTAEAYNAYSAAGQRAISQLRRHGHRLGLHVDPALIDFATPERVRESMKSLFDVAMRVLGPLDSYSLHRPVASGRLHEIAPENLGFRVPPYSASAAYQRDIAYRSDSRREWRSGCICAELPQLDGAAVQLNTHPIWWAGESRSRAEILERFLEMRDEESVAYLEANLSFYQRPTT